MAVNRLPFSDVSLKENKEDTSINVKKEKRVKRLVHFSDGVLEEYSTDEEEVDAPADNKRLIDPKTLTWMPYIWFHMANIGSSTLSVCDYLGERLAWMLGITSPKYQYEIDEAKRQEEEDEKEKQIEDEEYAGWKKKDDNDTSTVHLREPQLRFDEELTMDPVISSISSSTEPPLSNSSIPHSFAVHETEILSAEKLVSPEVLKTEHEKTPDIETPPAQPAKSEVLPIEPEIVAVPEKPVESEIPVAVAAVKAEPVKKETTVTEPDEALVELDVEEDEEDEDKTEEAIDSEDEVIGSDEEEDDVADDEQEDEEYVKDIDEQFEAQFSNESSPECDDIVVVDAKEPSPVRPQPQVHDAPKEAAESQQTQ